MRLYLAWATILPITFMWFYSAGLAFRLITSGYNHEPRWKGWTFLGIFVVPPYMVLLAWLLGGAPT